MGVRTARFIVFFTITVFFLAVHVKYQVTARTPLSLGTIAILFFRSALKALWMQPIRAQTNLLPAHRMLPLQLVSLMD